VQPIPIGRLIREQARLSNARPRDRWRERSVSRARDCLVASKRKTSGLPPVLRPSAPDSKFRVPSTVLPPLPPRHAGGYRSSISVPQRLMEISTDRRIDTVSSMNRAWLQDSIRVRIVLFLTHAYALQ